MPKYFYKCPNCGNDYLEQRDIDDPQFFTTCNSCKQAEYVEVTE